MEAGSRRGQLWNRPEGPTRSQPLRIRPGYLVRWPVRVEQLLGQHTSPVGPQRRSDDAQIHRTYEGCAERCVFGRQPADCVRIARPHYQTVEHAWTEQVHDHGEQKKQKKTLSCYVQRWLERRFHNPVGSGFENWKRVFGLQMMPYVQ